MKKYLLLVISIAALSSLVTAFMPTRTAVAQPSRVIAASCTLGQSSGGLSNSFFTPWYAYLPKETDTTGKCRPVLPTRTTNCGGQSRCTDVRQSILLIVVAVMELLTKLAGLIAVGYVIYGAVQYITSQGEAQNVAKAKTTITNALVGFVIVVLAVALIQSLGRIFS